MPLLLLLLLLAPTSAPAQRLTIPALVRIKYPSAWRWSRDGKSITFTWDEGGVYHRYRVSAEEPQAPTLVPGRRAGAPGGIGGGGRPNGGVLSPDGHWVARVRRQEGGYALVVAARAGGAARVLVRSARTLGGLSWSPDGRRIAYTVGARVEAHNITFPEIGRKLIFARSQFIPGKLYVVAASGGAPMAVQGPSGGYGGAHWVSDTTLVLSHIARNYKTRTLYLLDARGGPELAVHVDREDKFWSMIDRGAQPQVSPDGRWILFASDISGWDQLYVMPAAGGAAVQVTRGDFDSWRPVWSHRGDRIAFDANQPGRPGDRQIGVVRLNGSPADATVTWLTHGRGTNIAPVWSPHDRRLAYQHTDAQHSADLYVIGSSGGGAPLRLTHSMPASLDGYDFVAPKLIHYPAADGKSVPAWLFVPHHLDRARKHPAIVWIHPDGVNQNYDGWHPDRNEAVYYAFHQYLLQEGYIVIAPDYRGSIGYSRAWREAVYHDVGGEDATDARLAASYLKTLPYVDPNRIGVWGLSYGGYFTLTAITRQPTLFACAVDVAGLVNPAYYYRDPYHSGWMAQRMGTPAQNPGLYARAAVTSRIGRLQRPLLILAGTADVNVPFWETTLLLDSILKAGKGNLVQFMMYPGEFHYFDRAFVLEDAWRRVDEFFAAHLHPGT
jgi:dipeptidyl aminopeptidase/acylaminoacyl peptidase